MKIFISWSGSWGKGAAGAMKDWLHRDALPGELREADVLVSADIAKGAVWFEELRNFLDQACVALVCLTHEALRSPWVHYEVGAIAQALGAQPQPRASGRRTPVFTLLLGVKPGELEGPLAAFQSTVVDDVKDMRRLMSELLGEDLWRAASARAALNDKWPETWCALHKRLQAIPKPPLTDVFAAFDGLFRRKTFQEPTLDCVNQRWLERYDGARETWATLREYEQTIERACRPHVVDMYKALVAMVDQYAMAAALLVGADRFDIDERGHVTIVPPGLAEACERSRKRIKNLVARLTDPQQAPHFEEVFRFEVAESVSEKKTLIHRQAPMAEEQAVAIFAPENARWLTSDWDYDRIIYSLCLEHRVRAGGDGLDTLLDTALNRALMDLESTRAREGADAPADGSHLMSLSYALAPLECAPLGTSFARTDELRYLASSIRDLLVRGRSIRAAHPHGTAITTYEMFGTVILDSVQRIERVFGLARESALADGR